MIVNAGSGSGGLVRRDGSISNIASSVIRNEHAGLLLGRAAESLSVRLPGVLPAPAWRCGPVCRGNPTWSVGVVPG
jgi:hypothetical protein